MIGAALFLGSSGNDVGLSTPPQVGHGIHGTHGSPYPKAPTLLFPFPHSAFRSSSTTVQHQSNAPWGGWETKQKGVSGSADSVGSVAIQF